MNITEASPYIDAAMELVERQAAADPAHGIDHILRVLKNALAIAKAEGGDKEAIAIAALLHDSVNYPKDHPKAKESALLSADYAADFLRGLDYPENGIRIVHDAIASHSFSKGKVPETLEGKILQDADRLDALGAIGICRCLQVGGSLGRPLFSEDDPFCENGREPDDKRFIIDHFFQKLFKIPALMQTKTGKKMAASRTDFMRSFLRELSNESFSEEI